MDTEKLAQVVIASTRNLSWLRGPCGRFWLQAAQIKDADNFIRLVYEKNNLAAPEPLFLDVCLESADGCHFVEKRILEAKRITNR